MGWTTQSAMVEKVWQWRLSLLQQQKHEAVVTLHLQSGSREQRMLVPHSSPFLVRPGPQPLGWSIHIQATLPFLINLAEKPSQVCSMCVS